MKRVFKIVAMALVPVYIAVFLIFILPRSHSQQQLKAETEIIQPGTDMFEGSGSRGIFSWGGRWSTKSSSRRKIHAVKVRL